MKKLTAERCAIYIAEFEKESRLDNLSIAGEYYLQALEIALPILVQREEEAASNQQESGS